MSKNAYEKKHYILSCQGKYLCLNLSIFFEVPFIYRPVFFDHIWNIRWPPLSMINIVSVKENKKKTRWMLFKETRNRFPHVLWTGRIDISINRFNNCPDCYLEYRAINCMVTQAWKLRKSFTERLFLDSFLILSGIRLNKTEISILRKKRKRMNKISQDKQTEVTRQKWTT